MRESNMDVFRSRISNEGEFVKDVGTSASTYGQAIETGADLTIPELDLDAPKIRWHISGVNSNEDPWTE